MRRQTDPTTLSLMVERFGKDTLLSLATIDGNRPAVRIVDSYYEDGSFYTVTYALSGKISKLRTTPPWPSGRMVYGARRWGKYWASP